MQKTNVKVEFFITHEKLNLEIIKKELELVPTEFWMKGDSIQGKKFKKPDSCWVISTQYEESLNINEQIEKILNILDSKKNSLKEFRKKYDWDLLFSIVINIENNEKPEMYFEKKFIDFVQEIEAEFFIDLYVFS